MKTRMPRQPRLDHWMFVGGVIVYNQVDCQPLGRFPVNHFQERQPLLMSMLRRGAAQNLAVQIGQGRKQGDGSMPKVIVRLGF